MVRTITYDEVTELICGGIVEYFQLNSMETSFNLREDREPMQSELCQELILSKLEKLLFEGCTEEFMEEFNSEKGGLCRCSKSFVKGEVIYTCTQCAIDPTCVMCQKCFINSDHKNHKYGFSVSGGKGGCCDCGDTESWKTNPVCSLHSSVSNQKILTDDLKTRFTELFKILISYILSIANPPFHTPSWLKPHCDESYVLVLFNDEMHSFEQVMNILSRVAGIRENSGLHKAQEINSFGFSYVCSSYSYQECCNLKFKFDNFHFDDPIDPLLSIVISTRHFQHMCFVSTLMNWMYMLAIKKAEILEIFCSALIPSFENNFVNFYIKNEPELWKCFRNASIYYFFNTLLYLEEYQKLFAMIYCDTFPTIYTNFMTDTHSKHYFMINITVQFITTPSIVILLMERGLLNSIFKTISSVIKSLPIYSKRSVVEAIEEDHKIMKKVDRVFFVKDILLEFLGNPIPTSKWSPLFYEQFCTALNSFCDLLIDLNGMDEVIRKIDDKESDKYHSQALDFFFQINQMMKAITTWVMTDVRLCSLVLERLWQDFEINFNSQLPCSHEEKFNTLFYGKRAIDSTGSIFNMKVRFFIDIITKMIWNKTVTERSISFISDDSKLIYLAWDTFFSYGFFSHLTRGMWRRNSDSLNIYGLYYKFGPYCYYLYEQDLRLFQIMASKIEPRLFMQLLLIKICPFSKSYVMPRSLDSFQIVDILDQVKEEKFAEVIEDIVLLIYNIFVERHFVSRIENHEYNHLRKLIIQRLAVSPYSRKNLSKAIVKLNFFYAVSPDKIESYIDSILKEVADFKSSVRSYATYSLKPQFINEVNKFFYSYVSSDQSSALDFVNRRFTNDPSCMGLSDLTDLLPEYKGITEFILSQPLHQFLIFLLQLHVSSNISFDRDNNYLEMIFNLIFYICKEITLIRPIEKAREHFNKFKDINGCFDEYSKQKMRDFPHFVSLYDLIKQFEETEKDEVSLYIIKRVLNKIKEVDNFLGSTSTIEKQPSLKHEPDISPTALFKRRAEDYRLASLKTLTEIDEQFMKKNPDWLLYCENVDEHEEVDNSTILKNNQIVCVGTGKLFSKKVSTRINETRLRCFKCLKEEPVQNEAYSFFRKDRDPVVVVAKLSLARQLSKYHKPIDSVIAGGQVDSKVVLQKFSYENPHLYLSGCGHVAHMDCIENPNVSYIARSRATNVYATKFKCDQCTSRNSIYLPYGYPFKFEPASESVYESQSSFIKNVLKFVSSHKFDKFLSEEIKPLRERSFHMGLQRYPLTQTETVFALLDSRFCSGTSDISCYMQYKDSLADSFSPLFYFSEFFSDVDNLTRFDNVLPLAIAYSGTHDCYIYTMSCLESIFRSETRNIFHHSFVETTHFDSATHLARFCFNGSGLGHFVGPTNITGVKLIQTIIAYNCNYSIELLKTIFRNKKYEYFSEILLSTDIFKFLVHLFFGLSSLMLSCGQTGPNDFPIELISLDFYCLRISFLLITIQAALRFQNLPKPQPKPIIIESHQFAMEMLLKLFSITDEIDFSFIFEQKYAFFKYWMEHVLPFCRKAALLFYQISCVEPPMPLRSTGSTLPLNQLTHILPYLGLSFDLVAHCEEKDKRFITTVLKSAFLSYKTDTIIPKLSRCKISLVPLPSVFIDLVMEAKYDPCPKCSTCQPIHIMKCLYCGKWISSEYRCIADKVEEKVRSLLGNHMLTCGVSHGLFINITPPTLYYTNYAGSFLLAFGIYEDEYGESMLSSSNPLKLSPLRLERLKYLYEHDMLDSISSFTL